MIGLSYLEARKLQIQKAKKGELYEIRKESGTKAKYYLIPTSVFSKEKRLDGFFKARKDLK